ncbi:cytochrome C oxidase subunit IV family protein [Hydrocarboniphaga sp.]|uniref:cytochrome C oxidase subunit IV family protein n=1 Tax=Hydrocarboniphaga sp. TaxID=2033016 RepID=UPI003D0F7545
MLLKDRLTLTWLLLSALTAISWWIGSRHGHHAFVANAAITYSVILMAALKIRFILTEFMDLRHAPPLLRRIADAWLALLVIGLLALYSLGMR